jgi:hypothetical protein
VVSLREPATPPLASMVYLFSLGLGETSLLVVAIDSTKIFARRQASPCEPVESGAIKSGTTLGSKLTFFKRTRFPVFSLGSFL